MSGSVGGDNSGDVDLNLAPIIDCFTVLITYLLVSASFISLAVLDVGVAATGQADPPPVTSGPPLALTVDLLVSKNVRLKLTGGPGNLNMVFDVPPKTGGWDKETLAKRLEGLKSAHAALADVTVSAESRSTYRDVVEVVQEVKKHFTKVFLSGSQ